MKLYLISTGDYSFPGGSLSTQEMCVMLADRPDHPAIKEAIKFVASVTGRDEEEIVVNPIGKPE
jgi:hypothetical protein